ncbi:Nuclear receptor coregulator SMRT/SMRTER [Pseudoloma neurophilia]|uniref:Nuclear receptor coregulator SMRT/SMRTER n=1 Tax=Pseudoloma neurophilia TaxID=146866 RepID=A0A0R0LVC0_9MICR|nr:Nuclear receptor coregulator SMRT/SMRTER [Pseudoloma neurophilia]
MITDNLFKTVLEERDKHLRISFYQNGFKVKEENMPFHKIDQNFNEEEIKLYIEKAKKTLGEHCVFQTEKVERLINKTESLNSLQQSQSQIENGSPVFQNTEESDISKSSQETEQITQNGQIENRTVQPTKLLNKTESFESMGRSDEQTEKISETENVSDNFISNHDIIENITQEKDVKINFVTNELEKLPISDNMSINDEIARDWLNLTFKKEYSESEFQHFKLNNEINDMERYLINRAEECSEKTVSIEYRKVKNTEIVYIPWSESDHDKFVSYFLSFHKKFHIIASLMKKDIKQVILHYYNTKKTEKYHKKKNGRISDTNLNILINFEWTKSEKQKFLNLYKFYGKYWANYLNHFNNKNINDFKCIYRYLGRRNLLSDDLHGDNLEEIIDQTGNVNNLLDTSEKATDLEVIDQQNETHIINDGESLTNTSNMTGRKKIEKKQTTKRSEINKKRKISQKTSKKTKKLPTVKKVTPSKRNSPMIDNKENIANIDGQSIVNEWTTDERQLFAIFFPHIGKKWSELANYIITKKSVDCKNYYKFYFKNLSMEEQKFEASLRNISERKTWTIPNTPKKSYNYDEYFEGVGILFKK